jgi:ketosteroid isomerase-like protein
MKTKLILFAALLMCMSLTAFAQTERQVVKSKSNISNNRLTTEQILTAIEETAWNNLVAKKFDEFGKLLADDYQSVYGRARNTKVSELEGIMQTTFKSAVVSDLKVQMIGKDAAIVTALVKAEMLGADGKTTVTDFRTTSVYAKRENAWLLVFHTDEPLADAK